VAANPVHLMYVLEQQIEREQFPSSRSATAAFIKEFWPALRRVHRQGDPDRLPGELQRVRPEHLRPLRHLRRLLDPGPGVPRPDTGEILDRNALNDELEKIEKPAGISNPKDFRNEIVNFVLRARANNAARTPWTSYEKLRAVIEKKMFSNTEDCCR
jgi:serine protein kinase